MFSCVRHNQTENEQICTKPPSLRYLSHGVHITCIRGDLQEVEVEVEVEGLVVV